MCRGLASHGNWKFRQKSRICFGAFVGIVFLRSRLQQCGVVCPLNCVLWKHRNNKLWNNLTEHIVNSFASAPTTCWKIGIASGRLGRERCRIVSSRLSHVDKTSCGCYKCDVDASFLQNLNKIRIGICIRDDDPFVLAKTEWISPIVFVDIGEALGLLLASEWVHELRLDTVDFELDSKIVLDFLHSTKME